MQHYALFRSQEGVPWGCYPLAHAVLHVLYFLIVWWHNNSRLVGATSLPLLNFEQCKYKAIS
jgi:hypothetical protein